MEKQSADSCVEIMEGLKVSDKGKWGREKDRERERDKSKETRE